MEDPLYNVRSKKFGTIILKLDTGKRWINYRCCFIQVSDESDQGRTRYLNRETDLRHLNGDPGFPG